MTIDCVSQRFSKLRAMREKLCKSEDNWKEAFEARDWMLAQLKEFKNILSDNNVTRDQLVDMVSDLICVLEPVNREKNDD